ncbi:MAG: nitrilase-related carbon-nitrogen hydrolase [Alphaproteobacteria bacterium]
MTTLKLALWQAAPEGRDADAFCRALDAVMNATPADLVITPELLWPGYGDAATARAAAVGRDSALIDRVRALAAHHRRGVVLGYAEAGAEGLFNSAICIDPDGAVLLNYRKQTSANDYERACFGAGQPGPVTMLAGVPTAILICYDAEFPEHVRRAARDGARLVIVPTALGPKWRIVADVVIPTRAYENGIFVAYCNYATTPVCESFCGLSLVAGPDGSCVARAGHAPCVLEATIDLEHVDRHRGQLHLLRDLGARAD